MTSEGYKCLDTKVEFLCLHERACPGCLPSSDRAHCQAHVRAAYLRNMMRIKP